MFYFSFLIQKDSKETVLNLASEVRQIGNNLFKEKQFDKARKKYSKALRYCHHFLCTVMQICIISFWDFHNGYSAAPVA